MLASQGAWVKIPVGISLPGTWDNNINNDNNNDDDDDDDDDDDNYNY